MITIYDIAKKANVSAMTVSRVINNTGRISEKTRVRVRQVMEELHYVPNSAARSLVLQETRILSLLITDITNPFYTTLARGAEDAAMKRGYRLLFSNSDEDVGKEKEYLEMVLSTRVDGVLFSPAGDNSLPQLEKLHKHGIPFVLIDREVPGVECDTVLGDSRLGARLLVEHLFQLGHRRVALLNGSMKVSTARERFTGYAEALKLHDLPWDDRLVFEAGYGRASLGTIEEAVERMLALPERPTAVFAANNFLALDAVKAFRRRGLDVPHDLSVVCFDDLDPNSVLDPFLTVAAQPAYEFGSMGIRLLIDRIHGVEAGSPRKKIVLPPKLTVRQSSAPPRS
ncbi:LacI family DNA-binding transcriptional regulator [Paenibacillus aurantius]|uniref:LacI family DNA-binding transcriptional regulator n=1 Tax=Paenibacillus aurantius TaxID=2918900 RepID=A0AA96L9E0_9BACL|nr:LacI family DNA-binding transcriptional regulator [Paenibacillus aurantius]WNQ09441.1 LacI family DNA-binding transcriptional regulator [Paenibacillus aurantius]